MNQFREDLFICKQIENGRDTSMLNRKGSLIEGLYLLGYADIPRRAFVFKIVSFEGIEYLIPDCVFEEYEKWFLKQNYTFLTMEYKNLYCLFDFILNTLREYVLLESPLRSTDKVPPEILDFFYCKKKNELFKQIREKIKLGKN